MSVIIVGAGVGGLTTALALARRGVRSVVIERAPQLEEVGAGVQLSPNACRILFALGLEARLRQMGFAPAAVRLKSAATGRILLENRLGEFAEGRWGAPYLQIRRSALQTVLAQAVEASDHIDLRLGSPVNGLDLSESEARVTLSNGNVVHGSVLVGCDGLNSTVRSLLWGKTPARFTGQSVWRGLAPAAGLSAELQTEACVWAGPRKHFVHYPVGEGWVNMVAVIEADGYRGEDWAAAGEQQSLAKAFADWPAPVAAVIAAAPRPWRSALFDRPPFARWTKGRATLLGDAAHPMLPFLAQGVAMAIEDAAILSNAMAATLVQQGDPTPALSIYERARHTRTAKVQAWAGRNAKLFHLPDPALRAAFGAAALADRCAGRPGEARFDWLYGFKA